jgi:hypothetical protein
MHLNAERLSRTFVKDRQISPPFAHSDGDFNYHNSEIFEYSAPTQFGHVAETVRIIDNTALIYFRPSKGMHSNFPTYTSKSTIMRSAMPQAILSLEISHFSSLTTILAAHITDFIPQRCYGSLAQTDHCLPVSYINPKNCQTTEWLSSLSNASSQSTIPRRASSITTPSFIARPPEDDIRNYFKDNTTAAPEVNALNSSTVDTPKGAILRFPSDALKLT